MLNLKTSPETHNLPMDVQVLVARTSDQLLEILSQPFVDSQDREDFYSDYPDMCHGVKNESMVVFVVVENSRWYVNNQTSSYDEGHLHLGFTQGKAGYEADSWVPFVVESREERLRVTTEEFVTRAQRYAGASDGNQLLSSLETRVARKVEDFVYLSFSVISAKAGIQLRAIASI